jgi:O-antigen/teichoic acid export membrane protein
LTVRIEDRALIDAPAVLADLVGRASSTVELAVLLTRSDHSASLEILRVRLSADPLSVRRCMSTCLWRATSALSTSVERLGRGTSCAAMVPAAGGTDRCPGATSAHAVPSVRPWLLRYAWAAARGRMTVPQWGIGIAERSDESALDPAGDLQRAHISWPPADRSWADPFVVSEGRRRLVFFEEQVHEQDGRICVAELSESNELVDVRPVLQEPFHLSYPQVFQVDGEYFMLPEAGASRTVRLYRATDFPVGWELHAVLLEDVELYDPTILRHEGRWWLLGTCATRGMFPWDELVAYHADRITGPWMPHLDNPLKCDVIGSRPAGSPFVHDGRLVRPAQDCSGSYGTAIILQHVERLDTTGFREQPIARLAAPDARSQVGFHTLNLHRRTIAFDVRRHVAKQGSVDTAARRLHPRIASLYERLRGLSPDAVLAAATVVAGLGISYLLQLLLARTLGSSGYGEYSYVLGWVNVAQVFVSGELGTVALRFAGAYVRGSQHARLRGFLGHSVMQVLLLSLLTAGVTLLAVLLLRQAVPPSSLRFLWLGLLVLPLVGLNQLGQGLLIATGRGRVAQAPFSLYRPLVFLIALLVARQWLPPTTGLALGLNLMSMMFATWITLGMLRRTLLPSVRHVRSEPERRRWLVASAQLSLLTFAQFVISQQSDVVVVGTVVGTVAAGHYAAAGQLAVLLRILPTMVADLNSPKLASLHTAGDHEGVAQLVRRLNRLNFTTTLVFAAFLAALAPFLLRLFGPDFTSIYPTLLVLLLVQCAAMGIIGVGTTVLTMTGNERSLLLIVGLAAVFNIGAALLLTPWLGTIGAAVATLLATILRGVLTRAAVRRTLAFSMGRP